MTFQKYVIPFLALVLLIPGGIEGTFAQEIPGEEDFTDEIGPVGNTDAYIELLKLEEDYQNMTVAEQEIYISSANEFITSGSAYELARNKLLVEGSKISLQKYLTNDEEKLKELKSQHDQIWEQLEEFGVGPEDKVHNNTDYYFDKYDQALKQFEAQGYPATVSDVHTDDVSLSTQAGILFPCYPNGWNSAGTCPIRDLTYGSGTSHVEVWFMAPSGILTFESKVCNVNVVGHDSVNFELSVKEKANRFWGTNFYSNEESVNTFVDAFDTNSCKAISNSISVYASDNASLDSTLGSTITVSGYRA